jgi:hypothetical protein
MKALRDDPLLRLKLFADSNEVAYKLGEMSHDGDLNSTQSYYMSEGADHIKGLYKVALALARELRIRRRQLTVHSND